MTSAAVRPPLGSVHRASLEAFRQDDPLFAEYLEKHGRIVIVEEKKGGQDVNVDKT
jgi:hypothetical protein